MQIVREYRVLQKKLTSKSIQGNSLQKKSEGIKYLSVFYIHIYNVNKMSDRYNLKKKKYLDTKNMSVI